MNKILTGRLQVYSHSFVSVRLFFDTVRWHEHASVLTMPFVKQLLIVKWQLTFIVLIMIHKHYLDWHFKVATDVYKPFQSISVLYKAFHRLTVNLPLI